MSHHHRRRDERSTTPSSLPLPLLTIKDLEVLEKTIPDLSPAGQQLIGMITAAFEKAANSLELNQLKERISGVADQLFSPDMLTTLLPMLAKLNINQGTIEELLANLGDGTVSD